MLPLDSADDITALLRVVEELTKSAADVRKEINEVCDAADELGGIEELSQQLLRSQLEAERRKKDLVMILLETAEDRLSTVVSRLRDYTRADVIWSLQLHSEYSKLLAEKQRETQEAYLAYIELQQVANALDGKIASIANLSV